MGWKGVERWRGTTPHGTVWHVDLLRNEPLGPFAGGSWRVDWRQPGSTGEGKSFPAEQGQAARDFCEAKRAEHPGAEWELLSDIDITRPGPAPNPD